MATTNRKPWKNSSDVIEAIQRKISLPLNQITFLPEDLLAFANEEMMISEVPAVLQYHEEYFVYNVRVPLVTNVSRYPIPNRAIGMRLRDLFWSDTSNNFYEMTRINADDKAFFQRNIGSNQAIHKFYIEGNDVVLTPSLVTGPTGFLNFFVFLRPNQLVTVDRAAIINGFSQTITVVAPIPGDNITINNVILTTGIDFLVGVNDIDTANNLAIAIAALVPGVTASNGVPASNIVTFSFTDVDLTYTSLFPSLLIPLTTMGVTFDGIPDIFQNGTLVDFLQEKPGHRIYTFDIAIPPNSISGTTITFTIPSLTSTVSGMVGGITPPLIHLVPGDYICLQNECIIPGIPPDLHNSLCERTAARILASMGDMTGLQAQNQKIQEINLREGSLVDNRVEGSAQKITARHSLLRFGKQRGGRGF